MFEKILTSIFGKFFVTLISKPFKLIYLKEWEEFRMKYPTETNQHLLQLNFFMNCKVAKAVYILLAIFIFLSCVLVGITITFLPNPVHFGFIWYSKFWGLAKIALSSVPIWKLLKIAFE